MNSTRDTAQKKILSKLLTTEKQEEYNSLIDLAIYHAIQTQIYEGEFTLKPNVKDADPKFIFDYSDLYNRSAMHHVQNDIIKRYYELFPRRKITYSGKYKLSETLTKDMISPHCSTEMRKLIAETTGYLPHLQAAYNSLRKKLGVSIEINLSTNEKISLDLLIPNTTTNESEKICLTLEKVFSQMNEDEVLPFDYLTDKINDIATAIDNPIYADLTALKELESKFHKSHSLRFAAKTVGDILTFTTVSILAIGLLPVTLLALTSDKGYQKASSVVDRIHRFFTAPVSTKASESVHEVGELIKQRKKP